MRRKELLLVLFLAFSLLLVISSAFLIKDSYKIRGVISGGGGNLTGAYGLKLAVGQPVTGTTSGTHKICFGFFCILVPTGENSMNFTGYLNYSTGEPVKNSLITITIKNETLGFERSKSDETDDFGYFFVRIGNIPLDPPVMSSNLNITIHVLGEVEAVYECWYNHSSGNCTSY